MQHLLHKTSSYRDSSGSRPLNEGTLEAKHTSQLQPIALMNAWSHERPIFVSATVIAPAEMVGSATTPPRYANTYATNNLREVVFGVLLTGRE